MNNEIDVNEEESGEPVNFSEVRFIPYSIDDFKFNNEVSSTDLYGWGDRMRVIRTLIGDLSQDEIAKIEPNAWHLLMASYAKLHNINILTEVKGDNYSDYLDILENHIKDKTGKHTKVRTSQYPTSTIDSVHADLQLKTRMIDRLPLAREEMKNASDHQSVVIPVMSKGVILGFGEYLSISKNLLKMSDDGLIRKDKISKRLEETFIYADLYDITTQPKARLVPPDNFARALDNPQTKFHNILVEDQISSGQTIEKLLAAMNDLISDNEKAYRFFSKLHFSIGASNFFSPEFSVEDDGTLITWKNYAGPIKARPVSVKINYIETN